jgi:hypothetical protein
MLYFFPRATPDERFFMHQQPRTFLRISEIRNRLLNRRVVVPVPDARTIRGLIEAGVLEGHHSILGWGAFEDSFEKFVRQILSGGQREP